MSKHHQPIMSDFPEHQQLNIEAVAKETERLYNMLPMGTEGYCRGRCQECWAHKITSINTGSIFPLTLCFTVISLHNAMKLLVASKLQPTK